MESRGDLSDAQWARIEPLLPASSRRCGRWRDHRQVVNGILHRIRTGVPWRDVPDRYGPWKTVHERHRRWSADGTWQMLLRQVQAQEDAAGTVDWDICVDSTVVRAHHYAAGARHTPPSFPPDTGRSTGRVSTKPPPGGERSGAPGEALGRSRGGFTTKIHLSADGRCRILSLVITPGQRADCTQFEAVMDKIRVPRPTGRPRTTPDSVSADKGYSNRRTRHYLRRRGIPHTIPEKADQAANRTRRGRDGRRPPGFDEDRYKKRNTVERAINKLKTFRAVATRFDKRAYVYLGTVTTAALAIWLRS
ncbi:IS5 family transposase [Streptomyces europaeiscabiei]|uniref:IS5 family transposase n=1 Tax=Streptomyces europaeiscabiei TaxID=146819 RepID=UPI0029A162B2|nr:IS5 family transposase [Streptomyces europaeiscabiei]MDX2771940.1 IS5 family transposase [Streptomyces europaeiscabiei]